MLPRRTLLLNVARDWVGALPNKEINTNGVDCGNRAGVTKIRCPSTTCSWIMPCWHMCRQIWMNWRLWSGMRRHNVGWWNVSRSMSHLSWIPRVSPKTAGCQKQEWKNLFVKTNLKTVAKTLARETQQTDWTNFGRIYIPQSLAWCSTGTCSSLNTGEKYTRTSKIRHTLRWHFWSRCWMRHSRVEHVWPHVWKVFKTFRGLKCMRRKWFQSKCVVTLQRTLTD